MAKQKYKKKRFDDEGDYEQLVKRDLGRKRKHRTKKTKKVVRVGEEAEDTRETNFSS